MAMRARAKEGVEQGVSKGMEQLRKLTRGSFNKLAQEHLDTKAPVDTRIEFPRWRGDDASIAVLELFTSWGADIRAYGGETLALLKDEKRVDIPIESPTFVRVEVAPGEVKRGLRLGIVFGRFQGEAFIAHCWEHNNGSYTVRVIAKTQAAAERVLAEVQRYEEEHGTAIGKKRKERDESVNGRVRAHLALKGSDVHTACVRHELPAYLIPNATALLHRFVTEHGATIVGFETSRYDKSPELDTFLKEPTIEQSGDVKAVRATLPIVEEIMVAGTMHHALHQGVSFFMFDGAPVVLCSFVKRDSSETLHLWILADTSARGEALLARFLDFERTHSLLRGRLIRPQVTYREDIEHAEILDHQPVTWSDVVVPPDVEARLKTDVLEYAARADILRATGLELKRGVLLHGAPGTGKTLVCRLLATQLPGFTTIVVAGAGLYAPTAVFQLARKLSPALIVLEDIDLVGSERENNAARSILGSLLNELDGMGRQEQIIVVLTTNKIEVLEPALAERPGRIDTVIAMPEPNAALRARLLQHFSAKARIDDDAVDALVKRTDGASPAFLRELVKRAVLATPAASSAQTTSPVVIDVATALSALEAMTAASKDRATRRIIGFGS
jgi:cell division protease FtsH